MIVIIRGRRLRSAPFLFPRPLHALEATAVQRALGFSYETEKAFQTGVRMTVTETMPPDPNMLKFLLKRRLPDKYREVKEVQHTHNAGQLFQAFLKRMDERSKMGAGPETMAKCEPKLLGPLVHPLAVQGSCVS